MHEYLYFMHISLLFMYNYHIFMNNIRFYTWLFIHYLV